MRGGCEIHLKIYAKSFMKKPLFYFLILLGFNLLVFSHFSFSLLFVALYALLFLSINAKKTFLWLLFLNALLGVWVGVLWFFGDRSEAMLIWGRANCIVGLSLGLYYGRDFLFVAQSLQNLLPKKLNLLILMSAKMMGELKLELESAKRTLEVRACGRKDFGFLCHCYGYLIGKMICHGLQRAQKIEIMLNVRGYEGRFYTLRSERVEWKDWGILLVILMGVVC